MYYLIISSIYSDRMVFWTWKRMLQKTVQVYPIANYYHAPCKN